MPPALPAGALALLLVAGLAGCAAPPAAPAASPAVPVPPSPADQQRRSDFDKSLDSWHGAPIQELLRKLGKPESVTRRSDGNLDYQYSRSTRAGPDKRAAFTCTVRYAVDAGAKRVIGHAIEGC